jgi:hypothetical protein
MARRSISSFVRSRKWVVPEKIQVHTSTSMEKFIMLSGRGGEKKVSDNSKYIRRSKGVWRLTTNFLYGGGMDVFWNDPIDRILLDIYLFSIVHTARQ